MARSRRQQAPVAVDPSQAPALQGAQGRVLTNGMYQCTRHDYKGVPILHICGQIILNKKSCIGSHISKCHNTAVTAYTRSQASYTRHQNQPVFICDRPGMHGGWCYDSRNGGHSLRAHAQNDHDYKGESRHLKKPWANLTSNQQSWYNVRVGFAPRFKTRPLTQQNQALKDRLDAEPFPNR
ncbi:hypothetical protein HD806DRAFT_212997 [Xylariaceae sp. AK1471]|nr:hypothetical protein HD806DRAFT_212997 [Xylariaceae sp. AK1471]